MPQWDRWWPLGIAGGAVCLVAGSLLGLWYLASLFALPALLGLPLIHTLGGLGSGTVIYGTWGGLWALNSSRRARRRVRARQLALRGDLSAMPFALISADVPKVPEADDIPVEFAWRRRPKRREWRQALFLALLLSTGLIALLTLTLALQLDPRSVFLPSNLFLPSNQSDLIDAIGFLVFVVAETCFAVVAWVAFIQALFARLGPEYAICADLEGIRVVHLLGEGSLVPWAAVRLVEVSQYPERNGGHAYSVYTANTTVSWLDAQTRDRESPATKSERRDVQRRLLALIVARTGMQPRTCTPALMREPSTTRSGRWWAFAFKHGLPLTLFVMSLAAVALPLTPFVVLNAYAAVTSAVLGVAAVSNMRKPRESQRTAYYALPAAPKLRDESVEITSRARRAGRWREVLIGVLLSLNVVPAVVAMVTLPASPPAVFAAKVDGTLLFLVAMLGVAAIIDGLSRKRVRLTITSTSLTEMQGRKSTWLAWEEIVGLSVEMSEGAPASFTALGADGETISWPARRVTWRAQGGSPAPIAPEDLAAIVAQRSGVRLTIE